MIEMPNEMFFVFFLKWVLNLVYIILKFYYNEKCKLYLEVSWRRFSTEKVIFPISGAVHFVQWGEIFFQTPDLSNCLDFCSGAASAESHAELWDVYEVHWSLPRCNTDAQARCYHQFSTFSQNLSRACLDLCSTAEFLCQLFTSFQTQLRREKKNI